MAEVRVRLRNEANTATTAELDGAFDVSFTVERNDVGSGSFKLPNRDAERTLVSRGDVVRFALAGTGEFIARITDDRVVDVSEGGEDAEATEFICRGILSDWEEAVVQASDVYQCDLVPSLDERIWNWASGEYNPIIPHSTWPLATAIAGQGWGSIFYTGQPAGWTDSAAFFLWSSLGDSEDAPPGRCVFKDIFLVGAGKKLLEWACDNAGDLYVNGKKVQSGSDFRKKQNYEFETTAGFLTLAWDVTNAADDGPPGGNPGGLIASLRENNETGDIIWRTDASGPAPNNALTMRMLEYPVFLPPTTPGAIIRLAAEQNELIDDDWTLNFSDLYDSAGNEWAPLVGDQTTIDELSFRLYDDSLLAVLRVLSEVWIDFRVLPGDGKVLSVYPKGTLGTTVTVPLTTGYSTAGMADPDIVNVLDLSWNVVRAKYDKLGVRWADGWIELGSGRRWSSLRLEQINDRNVAVEIGERMLDLYGVDQLTASFKYLPLDEGTDLPLVPGFDVHDEWAVPGPLNPDGATTQIIQSINVIGDEDGEADFVIEVGPQVLDEIAWLERAIQRAGPSGQNGKAAGASPASGKAPYHAATRFRASAPTAGAPAHVIASAPNAVAGVSVAPNLFVGKVITLRLEAQGATGTSTVTVFDGTTTYNLSGTGEGRIAVTAVNEVWTTVTQLTVTIVTVGHTNLHVYADVSEITD